MFEMSSLRTRFKPTAPLVNAADDDGLLHSLPNLRQSLFKFVNIVQSRLVDRHAAGLFPRFYSPRTGLRSGLFGGQMYGDMNSGVACSRKLIMSRARCAEALSC